MPRQTEKSAEFAAEVILHLGRLCNADGSGTTLTGAQWAALRYFAHANEASRTVTAFADYHVTTRGTASETIKKLIARGLLERSPSHTDQRSALINLTAQGQTLCEQDPLADLVDALAALPSNKLTNLSDTLQLVMGHVADDRQRRRIGTCPDCGLLVANLDPDEAGAGSICKLTGRVVGQSDLDALCINFRPRSR